MSHFHVREAAGWCGDICLPSFPAKIYPDHHHLCDKNRKQERKPPGSWLCLVVVGRSPSGAGRLSPRWTSPLPQPLLTGPRQGVSLDARPAPDPGKPRYAGSTPVLPVDGGQIREFKGSTANGRVEWGLHGPGAGR